MSLQAILQLKPPQAIGPRQASWVHAMSQVRALVQSIGPTQLGMPPHTIRHAPVPQVTPEKHAPGPAQSTLQSVAWEQFTPAEDIL